MSSLIREKAFVNGAWVAAASGKTFEVRSDGISRGYFKLIAYFSR